MEELKLESLTDEIVSYRYYPEGGEEYGIVSLNLKTSERILDLLCPDWPSSYAGQAWMRLEEYQSKNYFPEKALVMWY